MWVGSSGGGLNRLDLDTGENLRRWLPDADRSDALPEGSVIRLEGNRHGELVVAALRGIAVLDTRTEQVRRVEPGLASNLPIADAALDGPDELWLATAGGVLRVDLRDESIVEALMPGCGSASPDTPGLLLEDSELWVTLRSGGICRYDRTGGSWDSSPLLAGVRVFVLGRDDQGFLWAGTNRGLARVDRATGAARFIGPELGAQSLEYNERAFAAGPGGELAFGGVSGLDVFRPESLAYDLGSAESHLVSVSVLEPRGASFVPIDLPVAYLETPRVELPPGRQGVRIEFAALDYSASDWVRYRVRLSGRDREWIDVGSTRSSTYTGLSPGQYTFELQASLAGGEWKPAGNRLEVVVPRPFWQRSDFLGLIGLAVALVVAGLVGRRRAVERAHRRELRLEVIRRTEQLDRTLRVVKSQAERLERLDQAKSEFFANVAHELRSPLAVILGTLEELSGQGVARDLPESVGRVRRSTDRLLRLVNQILDTAKIESGRMQVELVRRDLSELLREQVNELAALAEVRGIQVSVETPDEPVLVPVDEDKISQVFSNLLTNALKFSPAGGEVAVSIRRGTGPRPILVEVRDQGPGILEEDRGHVFDRYFTGSGDLPRATPSTGIGLALARDLVELHHGRISVSSEPGAGASFIVELPDREAPVDLSAVPEAEPSAQEPTPTPPAEPEQEKEEDDERPILLVVEDEADLREVVARLFSPEYLVLEAEDGERGLAVARRVVPDIVVSDVRMPKMDGLELCEAIRADPVLTATAVLLLTARSGGEEVIEGLERGADDYVVKPFARRELLARVRSLISARQRLRKAPIAADPPPMSVVPSTPEQRLLARVESCLEEHLHDEELTVDRLARHLAMSRVHLYRQLQAAAGISPSQMILEARLKRSSRLLMERAGNVSEIAYGVGFKSLSHFSRKFSERFGCPPSEYARREGRRGRRAVEAPSSGLEPGARGGSRAG